jgi:hypothetical protein
MNLKNLSPHQVPIEPKKKRKFTLNGKEVPHLQKNYEGKRISDLVKATFELNQHTTFLDLISNKLKESLERLQK